MLRARWLVLDFVPAGVELTPPQRASIRQAVRARDRNLWRTAGWRRGLLAAGAGLGLLAALAATYFVLDRRVTWLPDAGVFIVPACVLAGYVTRLTIYAPVRARNTYDELRRRGFEVCPECGYSMRGLEASIQRCPECGHEREPLPAPTGAAPAPRDPLREDMPPAGFDQWS